MGRNHIETYIELRQSLTRNEWEKLDGLYEFILHKKERQLTKDLTLNDGEIEIFRSSAQELNEISE